MNVPDVHICTPRKNNVPLLPEGQQNVHSWHYSKFTEDANTNKQKWCYCQSKNFSGKSDTRKHLKTFRIISNKMPVLLLVLYWWHFSCLQMYSEKLFNIYFHEKIFFVFSNFVPWKGDTGQFFLEITAYEQYKFH